MWVVDFVIGLSRFLMCVANKMSGVGEDSLGDIMLVVGYLRPNPIYIVLVAEYRKLSLEEIWHTCSPTEICVLKDFTLLA
jgi:hypothetical protein